MFFWANLKIKWSYENVTCENARFTKLLLQDHFYSKIYVMLCKFVTDVIYQNIARSYFLFKITFILKSPGSTNFTGIVKIAVMLIKKIYQDSIKIKIQKSCIKMQLSSAFPDITKVLFFWWRILMSSEIKWSNIKHFL